MSFDAEGAIAEFLVELGADDSLLNLSGLSPYEGV
jgi:hypothetical protein